MTSKAGWMRDSHHVASCSPHAAHRTRQERALKYNQHIDLSRECFRMKLSPCLLASLLVLAVTAQAADRSSESIAAELRDKAMRGDSVAWDIVSELTTRIGPRPAGSPSERAAAEWSAKKLKALGFENVRIEPFPMTAWIRGTERVEITSPSPQPVVAGALGGSPATPAGGVEGELVLFATLDDLKAAMPGSLNGKIAMITRPMPVTQDGSGYGA